ncbi:MAG TPA: hypothetical protein VKU03_13700 [Roseiarcus sp.]|jgi:hypothetical protein|nr:hypothetical protein [Roseiarcus sp.]
MLPLIVFAMVSASVPNLDIAAGCKPEAQIEGQIVDLKACMDDERATKDKLLKEWSSYSAAARNTCATDQASLVNSYVELLACIEMQTWKADPAVMNPSGPPGAAAAGGPVGSPPTPTQLGGGSLASHPLGGRPGGHMP